MQSGISISPSLRSTFNDLVSASAENHATLALIAKIDPSSESVIPAETITSDGETDTASFFNSHLQSHLSSSQAAYILLHVPDTQTAQSSLSSWRAVTFVPDSAPVRQKMLFASTRLSLVRELGKERFLESVSLTDVSDFEEWVANLDKAPTAKTAINTSSSSSAAAGVSNGTAPLTAEEEMLCGIKEAEAQARGGMSGRRLQSDGKLSMKISDEARQALADLGTTISPATMGTGTLVQLCIDLKDERIELVSSSRDVTPGDISAQVSPSEPRYALYRYIPFSNTSSGGSGVLLFIYSCPAGLKVRERMLYASCKGGFLASIAQTPGGENGAGGIGLQVTHRMEVSQPEAELSRATIEAEILPAASASAAAGGAASSGPAGGQTAQQQGSGSGFARPKRPGRK